MCYFVFFRLTEELEKAKMQSYRSVEQLEALSGKYHNEKGFKPVFNSIISCIDKRSSFERNYFVTAVGFK